MTKFDYIVIKDPHFAFGFRNNIRKHGWERAIDSKLDQIITYMKEKNIKNLFFTGDVFDKSLKKDWSLNQFQENKKRLQKFKDAGIDIYSNAGNHDYFSGLESIKGTVFGEMVDIGLLNYIGSEMEPVRFDAGEGEVLLFGIDYHVSVDQVLTELQEVSAYPRGEQSAKICLTHANITSDREILTDLSYNQIADYDIDTMCCGHWHLMPKGGAVQEIKETTFLNPWNLTRVSREYHTKLDEHKPQFIHAEIYFVPDEKPHFHYEEVFLNVGKFTETFNIDIINMLQELGKSKFGFFDEVGEDLDQDEDMSDDAALIRNLAQTHSISKEAVEIAKGLIT